MNSIYNIYKSMLNEREALQNSLVSLKDGYIREKIINGHCYYYLQHRDGTRVISEYLNDKNKKEVEHELKERANIEARLKKIEKDIKQYESILGITTVYHPVKNVDYKDYTLFMSRLAHDYKRLGPVGFLSAYDISKFRGLNKRYLKGYIDYITGIKREKTRKSNDLVLDPYTYQLYFEYGDKDVLKEELAKAIPEFLNQGLLITDLQEAVNGTFIG